jgi:hypothetical protein
MGMSAHELDALRARLSRMEGVNKRKSAKGSFSVSTLTRLIYWYQVPGTTIMFITTII